MRLSLPDDRPGAQPDGPVTYDANQMYRLPILHLGVSVGRADHRMGLARPENTEVHPLCGPLRPASAPYPQWPGIERRRRAKYTAKTL